MPLSFISVLCTFSKGDGDIKEAEMTKRKLSADLSKTRAHIAIKTRDGESKFLLNVP